MQDDDVSGDLPEFTASMLEELFSAMKRAPLQAPPQREQELPAATPAPAQEISEEERLLLRPDVFSAMSKDPRYAEDFDRLRLQAEQSFNGLLNDALQWVPVGVSSAVSGNLAMGSTMEVRDLMAASRRNLAGSGSNHDERRLMAQYLAVAGVHNFHRPDWNPDSPSSYAEPGGNLLSALLSPPAV